MAVGATVLTILTIAPAHAGGSWLEPTWVRVEAGDQLSLSGDVSPGQLGWVGDGPYFAYLSGETYGTTIEEGRGGNKTDVLLGQLTIEASDGWATVSIDITIPEDTPPGEYWVNACNDPCTTGFGDLIGAVLYVTMDPPDSGVADADLELAPTATSAPTTTVAVLGANAGGEPKTPRATSLALAPHPSRSTGLKAVWVAISASIGLAVLAFALAERQRGEDR